MSTLRAQTRQHPFPTVRSGGLFVLLVGAATVASTLLSGAAALQGIVFAAGFALAIAVGLVVMRPRLSYGEQTRTQRLAVIAAIGLEMAMILAIVNVLRPQDPRTLWLWLFLAVGIHFLPFGVVHGPKMALLGVLCIVNALLGLSLGGLPFALFGLIDGALKMGFGALMLLDRPIVEAVAYVTLRRLGGLQAGHGQQG